MKISMKRLTETATLPTRAHSTDAGYDLYADIPTDLTIAPHTTTLVGTGIAAAIPEGYFGGIFARSGLSVKRHLAPSNKVGVVDTSYRGEIKVALHNHSNETQVISPNERIAQLVVIPFLSFDIEEVNELDETERGSGGFGSSGTH